MLCQLLAMRDGPAVSRSGQDRLPTAVDLITGEVTQERAATRERLAWTGALSGHLDPPRGDGIDDDPFSEGAFNADAFDDGPFDDAPFDDAPEFEADPEPGDFWPDEEYDEFAVASAVDRRPPSARADARSAATGRAGSPTTRSATQTDRPHARTTLQLGRPR